MLGHLFGHHQKPIAHRTPQTLQVGDALSYLTEDFTVEQRQELHGDGGDIWWTYVIQGADQRLWLDVDEDEGLTLTIYTPTSISVPMPIASQVTLNGVQYRVNEHGFANAIITKHSGQIGERIEYWYLNSSAGDEAVVRRLGDNEVTSDPTQQTGTIEVGIGKEIKQYEINIYQAEQTSQP